MIAEMVKARGYVYPEWELSVRMDPEFIDAYNQLASLIFLHEGVPTEGKTLPAKYRELVALGILTFRGRERAVEAHMRRAMSLGATAQEIFEALEAMALPGGAPAYSMGVEVLLRILKEKGDL